MKVIVLKIETADDIKPIKFRILNHKYNDEELLVIYKAALRYAMKSKYHGLCSSIYYSQPNINKRIHVYRDADHCTFGLLSFNEIYKRMPKNAKLYWFPYDEKGQLKRCHILKQAVIEVEIRIKKSKK